MMDQNGEKSRFESLRRAGKALDKQLRERTAELEKVKRVFSSEIARLKQTKDLLRSRVEESTVALSKARASLRVESAERTEVEQALNRSREELRTLAARLNAIREEERTVLAREIHDELSGTLTALKMDISLLPDRAAKDRDLFLKKLSSMSQLIDVTLARLHGIVTELRPVVLDKFGLVAAIEWQAGEFQDRCGILCETHLPDDESGLDAGRCTAVFRIFQEALSNIARHARATKVVVDLSHGAGNLILLVRDNGKGIEKKAIYAHNSMGLMGMQERALSFGGKTEISALPEGGTLVRVAIPVNDPSRLNENSHRR